jgi:ATP-binding cassette subfamily F protein uup
VLLVSHDRDFLDALVTSTIVLAGDGRVDEYVGGYSDWLRQRPAPPASVREAPRAAAPAPAPASAPAAEPKKKRLSYKDARELAQLPARIETLEAEIAALTARQSEPAFFRGPREEVQQVASRIAAATLELEAAYARWAELDG